MSDLEAIITQRFETRENALIVECDALRAELLEAHNRTQLDWQSARDAQVDAALLEEMRAERDAARLEIADLRAQVKEHREALRALEHAR